jgi:hypothetical protein
VFLLVLSSVPDGHTNLNIVEREKEKMGNLLFSIHQALGRYDIPSELKTEIEDLIEEGAESGILERCRLSLVDDENEE